MFSTRYIHSAVKSYDGILRGSSSLWAFRMSKLFGSLPIEEEHQVQFGDDSDFDYNAKQIACAKKFRAGFYKRIFSPEDIASALHSCPVQIDIEIFESIYGDQGGIITMPDDEDEKVEFSHSVVVLKFNRTEKTFLIYTNWPWWGSNGYGLVSSEYLRKYILSAFVMTGLPKLGVRRKEILRKKLKLAKRRYFFYIFLENYFYCDNRQQLNLEVAGPNGDLIGWTHFAVSKKKEIEILDIFVSKEHRRKRIGSFMIKVIREYLQSSKITGYIGAHDLIDEREEILKSFFLKNELLLFVDQNKYKDCRFRIEPL